jgi:hypothetical protein
MKDPKALQFFQEILNKTKTNRIPWEPTANESEFIAPVGGQFMLMLKTYNNDYGVESNALVLKDSDGREVLWVDTDVEGVTGSDMGNLYRHAKRQALRVDDKIDRVLAELTRL